MVGQEGLKKTGKVIGICQSKIAVKPLLLFVLLFLPSFGQLLLAQSNIPVGTWTFHQSYTETGNLSGSDNTVFYQSASAVFYFSVADPEPKSMTRMDGLYGQHFTASAFDPASKTFILAYPDGTIDLVKERKVISLTSLRENAQLTNKNISHIKCLNGQFFLAAAFGFLQVDPESGVMVEAFINIGADGSELQVSDIAIGQEYYYLATASGLYRGDQSLNLRDFRNWELLDFGQNLGFLQAEIWNGHLFLKGADRQIYLLEDHGLGLILGAEETDRLKISGNSLFFSKGKQIYELEENGSFLLFYESEESFSDFHLTGKGIFLNVPGKGVFSDHENRYFSVSGPFARVQNFHWGPSGSLGLPYAVTVSGETKVSENLAVSKLHRGQWESVLAPENLRTVLDFHGTTYFGTDGGGLWKVEDGNLRQVELPGGAQSLNVSALAIDAKNQMWIGLGDSQGRLFKMNVEGEVQAVQVTGLQFVYKIIPDRSSNLWILQSSNSAQPNLKVYNETSGLLRTLTSATDQGGLPGTVVLDIDMDLDSRLWLGLESGVAYISNAGGVGPNTAINAVRPLFENRPLLQDQTVNALLVAPDQSKWFGTARDGLWHFSEFGDEVLGHFRHQNSPLTSNTIRSLHMDPISGELLLVLPDAAMAYRGGSMRAFELLSDLKIYPNPVRPDFVGLLSVEGLSDFAHIKITNAVGRVVYSAQVRGGKASWNLRDSQGGRLPSGVYLVYIMDDFGGEKVSGKFLVL